LVHSRTTVFPLKLDKETLSPYESSNSNLGADKSVVTEAVVMFINNKTSKDNKYFISSPLNF
jgi:hypothetical protein